jgi:hypothetical protein
MGMALSCQWKNIRLFEMPVTGLLPEFSRLAAGPVHGYAGGRPARVICSASY